MSCISRRVTNVAERNANCCSRQRASFNAAGFLSIHFEGAKKIKRVSVPSSTSSFVRSSLCRLLVDLDSLIARVHGPAAARY